ncbi:unnamed protein product [Brachionus calyciflorus]|uniref:Uncharacterized protein n=1 Tax=Brachionus calyciflorus TaxID=104777 RepID=A0A814HHQ1_9BILA|nr:unnamed protein product [Brachionus calyciflorus]
MYLDNDLSEDELVRSAESCRTNLLKWRAKWDKNSNRPLFNCPHNENGILKWIEPVRNKKILMSHDESIFRYGKGRSIVISIFIIQSKTVDLFELDEEEYQEALRFYPELDLNDKFINYYPRSANA